MPNIFHPAAGLNPGGIDAIPLTISSDVDLTDAAGQTGGYMARAILIGATAGNLKVDTLTGTGRVIPVAANQRVDLAVKKVYSVGNGTTAAGIVAIL